MILVMKEKISNILRNSKDIFSYIINKIIKVRHILIPIMMLIIVPICISFILGTELINHQVSHVPTMIVNHDNSSTTEGLVNQIKENDAFNVIAYSDSDNDIKDSIDKGEIILGIIIPSNFGEDLINGNAPKIMTIYDGAQTASISAGKGKIAEILGTIKSGYLIGIAEGKLGVMPKVVTNSIIPIQYESRFIGNPTKNMPNFFLQGILLTSIQVGAAMVSILIIDKKDNYLKIWIKGTLVGLISSITCFFVLFSQHKYFGVPLNGSIKAIIILTVIYFIGMSNFGVLLNLLKKGDKEQALASTGIVGSTMMLAGYTYPILAMPPIFTKIAKYNPFTYYCIPMRDLSLRNRTFEQVLPDIKWLFNFMILMWGLTFLLYLKNKKSSNTKKDIEVKECNNSTNEKNEVMA